MPRPITRPKEGKMRTRNIKATDAQWARWQATAEAQGLRRSELIRAVLDDYCTDPWELEER